VLESLEGVKVDRIARAAGGLELDAVVRHLAAREVNELMVECGPTLAGAFVSRHLVDELILYMAPELLGADAAPLLRVCLGDLAQPLPAYEFRDVRRVGDDVRLVLSLKNTALCSPE
jgi:diaminohydroxyphosphoribosylaminopyrimidine deaminase/5-amino-6-(5-phosphoribosylamino)uracil reductase